MLLVHHGRALFLVTDHLIDGKPLRRYEPTQERGLVQPPIHVSLVVYWVVLLLKHILHVMASLSWVKLPQNGRTFRQSC